MLKRSILAHYFKVLTRDIGEIWSDVYGKRQTWICTSWPSFLFSFRSQFVVTSRKSADSSQFYPKELFWAICIRSFCILRICQLESDVCRKRDSTSLYFQLAIFVMFGNFPNLRNFPIFVITILCFVNGWQKCVNFIATWICGLYLLIIRPLRSWGPFLESPGNFSGPKSNI